MFGLGTTRTPPRVWIVDRPSERDANSGAAGAPENAAISTRCDLGGKPAESQDPERERRPESNSRVRCACHTHEVPAQTQAFPALLRVTDRPGEWRR